VQFTSLPESEHELVALRPLTPADIPQWFAYLTLPLVFEHTSWNVQSAAELEHYAGLSHQPSALLRLAIAERATDQLVGTIGFHSVSPENRSAELAYDLSPPWWGKGIASQMCEVMVQWAHEHVGLLRVQATVLTSNSRSIEVLQRCGFKREGLLRSYRIVRGRPGDFWMYSHVQGVA
jgi:[ribosomal protein S5]-alanine N-acetyltransferase